MNNILKLMTIFLICFAFSCKDSKNVSKQDLELKTEPGVTPLKKDNLSVEKFTLIIKGIITKEDNFQVFYIESEADSHTEQKSVWVKVSPSDYKQEIKFELPEGVYPKNLRIDLGNNKKQESITINELILKYKKYDFKIKGSDLLKYFKYNDEIKMLSDSLTFKFIPILYNGVEKYDPYMVGNKGLENLLLEEL